MSIESPKFKKKPESEKEVWIKEIEQKVDETTDKLDLPIDPKIKDVVVGFNIWKIPTSQSCEGHSHKEGASFPWVEIYTKAPKGWKEDEEKKREWTIENLKQRKRTMEMLDEFYQDRETQFDARLAFSNIGIYGGFRVQSAGAELMPLFSPKEQKEKLELYRREMDDFAGFLKEKFLKES